MENENNERVKDNNVFESGRNGSISEQTIEETPVMRSMALLREPPQVLFSGFSANKQGDALNFSFGLENPKKLGISKPTKGLKATKSRESFGVKQEWSATTVPRSWNVNGEELDLVPIDFPLERTHREIKEDAALVATRISDALKVLSIESEFDNKKAKAKCTTTDCVNFRIRLYAGGEKGMPVVVEVQRRCGSAFSFMRSCRAILDAAEGKQISESIENGKKLPPFIPKPITEMKCIKEVQIDDNKRHLQCVEALENTIEMIRASRRDLTFLGLENLCSLTDPLKTNPISSLEISKEIILNKQFSDMREEIRVLTDRDLFSSEFDQDDGPQNNAGHFRLLALRVFSNALNLCSSDGCLAKAITEDRWFTEQLIPSFVDEVKRADASPNSAYEAICALMSLINCSSVALQILIDHGCVDALENAKQFGLSHHELLANEALRCLDFIKETH